MGNNYIGIFDIIGPMMVGPSSSHTSGAATIAWMARQISTDVPVSVTYTLYGSFADTYLGHGTDRALIGGMLGYKSDDIRIREAYDYARKEGLAVEFIPDRETEVGHPNTVDITMRYKDGHEVLVRGESIGGGRVQIKRINDIDVNFTGEYSTLVVNHQDAKGTIAFITTTLAENDVNIATLKLFREDKGKEAITIIETDGYIPHHVIKEIENFESVKHVDLIEI